MYVLNGISSDYNFCVCSLNDRGDDITMVEVQSQLLSYEHLLAKQNKGFENQVIQANFVRDPGFNDKPRGFGGNFRSNGGRRVGYNSGRGRVEVLNVMPILTYNASLFKEGPYCIRLLYLKEPYWCESW